MTKIEWNGDDACFTLYRCLPSSSCSASDLWIEYDLKRELDGIQADFFEKTILQDLQIVSDENRLKVALTKPLMLKAHSGNESYILNSMSLFKLLLDVDTIQPKLLKYLIDKLIETDVLCVSGEKNASGEQILDLLRCVQYIEKPAELTMKLLEALSVVKLNTQRALIRMIPELTTDSEHKIVVAELTSLLSANSDLISSIMIALANLQITDRRTQSELLDAVVERFASADIEDVPSMLIFLFQTANKTEIGSYLAQLRRNLDINSLAQLSQNIRDPKQKANYLVIDALRTGLNVQFAAVDAWIKILDAEEPKNVKSLDVIAMVIIHSINTSVRRKIYRVIGSKLPQAALAIEKAIRLHPEFAAQFFNDFMVISINCDAIKFSFPPLFEKLDAYYQQEIIGALALAVGNGLEIEAAKSIELLQTICDKYRSKIRPFSMMIKSLLDFSMEYSINIIRDLYYLVSGLTLACEGSWQNELIITIRKQISNPCEKWKKIGIVGAVQYIRAMDRVERTMEASSSQATDSRNHNMVIKLLEAVFNNCKTNMNCFRIFAEELSKIVPESGPALVKWIYENIASLFQGLFIHEISGSDSERLWMPTEDAVELDLAINILPNSLQKFETDQSAEQTLDFSKSRLHIMCSLFDVLHACESRANAGNLEEIDALLSCGLLMDSIDCDTVERLEGSRKDIACFSIYFAIQWFRKLLNVFSSQPGADIRKRCIERITHLAQLEHYLMKTLQTGHKIDLVKMSLLSQTLVSLEPIPVTRKTENDEKENNEPESDVEAEIMFDVNVYDSDRDNEADLDGRIVAEEHQKLPTNTKLELQQLRASFVELESGLIILATLDTSLLDEKSELWLMRNLENYLCRAFDPIYRSPLSVARRKRQGIPDNYPKMDFAKNVVHSILGPLIKRLRQLFAGDEEFNQEIVLLAIRSVQHILDSAVADAQWSRKVLASISTSGQHDGRTENTIEKQSFDLLFALYPDQPLKITAEIACAYLLMLSRFLESTLNPNVNDSNVVISAIRNSLSNLSSRILSTEWNDRKNIDEDALKKLLTLQIRYSPSPEDVMLVYASQGIPALLEKQSDVQPEKFPVLTRETLAVHFQVIACELGPNLQSKIQSKSNEAEAEDEYRLNAIDKHCAIFRDLMAVLKTIDTRSILNFSLKYGRQFVEIFSRVALPIIERSLVAQKDRTGAILRSLQNGTRTLQNVCAHAKTLKDPGLTAAVPLVRKALESFIFTIKAMLGKHNSLGALWIGNLKHRDLRGQIVSSQIAAASLKRALGEKPKKRRKRTAVSETSTGAELMIIDEAPSRILSNSTVNSSDSEN